MVLPEKHFILFVVAVAVVGTVLLGWDARAAHDTATLDGTVGRGAHISYGQVAMASNEPLTNVSGTVNSPVSSSPLVGIATQDSQVRTTTYQENSARIALRGSWSRAFHRGYLGHFAASSNQPGASASLQFTGIGIAWIGPTGPTRGKAAVYVDGRFVRTIDTYSPRFSPSKVLYSSTYRTQRGRSIEIRVLGTAGRPTVALDAFIVRASPTPAPTPVVSSGRTFYLSPSGSDSASGSLSAPRRTILAGSALLAPGDTLLVRGGTYHDPGGYNWAATASGTAAAPITIKAYPGETPLFDGGLKVEQALIISNVDYVTVEGLSFTRDVPYDNGTILILGSSHVTLRAIHSYGNVAQGPGDSSTDHHVYIVGSSDIIIDGCSLDGLPGAAIHIYGASSARVTVTNSYLTHNGTGILAGSGLAGGTFSNNHITDNTSYGIHFNSPTSNVVVRGNTIIGPVGIWSEVLGSYGPAAESNDCLSLTNPFSVGWPGSPWTLAQWRATGRGAGTTVGACS
jgi:hypothetical protein